jgi:hypothetical protein
MLTAALRLSPSSEGPYKQMHYFKMDLAVRILTTDLVRIQHSGLNEGREGLIRLRVYYRDPLKEVVERVACEAKIHTSTTAHQITGQRQISREEPRGGCQQQLTALESRCPIHLPEQHRPVTLHLQIGKGSSSITEKDLEEANAELRKDSNMKTSLRQLKFLDFHRQGAALYLLQEGSTSPVVDPPWTDKEAPMNLDEQGVPNTGRETREKQEADEVEQTERMDEILDMIYCWEPSPC